MPGIILRRGVPPLLLKDFFSLASIPPAVLIPENGVDAMFFPVQEDYESSLNGSGRVLLVRAVAYTTGTFNASNGNGDYTSSRIDSWLNSTYRATFSTNVRAAISTTSFFYRKPDGDPTGRYASETVFSIDTASRAVFLPSAQECGFASIDAATDGTKLTYATTLCPTTTTAWTRSVVGNTVYDESVMEDVYTGTYSARALNTTTSPTNHTSSITRTLNTSGIGVRPAFTLPSDTPFDRYTYRILL